MSNNTTGNKPTSWLEWFQSRESAPKIDESMKKALLDTFNASKSEEDAKKAVLNYKETAFLLKQNFGKNKLNIFHHLEAVGGNIYHTEEHFGAIQGVEKELTCIVTIDMPQLLDKSNAVGVPLVEDYLKTTNENEYKSLRVSSNLKFASRNFVPIPPFLLQVVNDTIIKTDGDSKEVLLAVIERIKDFDDEVKTNGSNIELAEDTCGDFLHWIYLASKNKVKSTPTIGCSVKEVRSHFKNIQMIVEDTTQVQALQPTNTTPDLSTSIQRPLEMIAASSSSTQDFLCKLTQIQSTNQDKSSSSFGKLSERIQNMMLVASSRGTVVPTELEDEAMNFFKLSSVSKAQQFLESYLESRSIECTIQTAVANLLLQGCFLWTNPLTPSGLAGSVIASKDVIFNNSIHEGILLDFSTKHEISKASLSKLTKTQVMYPGTIELVIERIEALVALTELFFSDRSILTDGLSVLLRMSKMNKTLLRTKLYLDKMFIAKFLFSIDDRINKWLGECAKAKDITETSLELIDFSTIVSDLKLNRYFCDLPSNIKMIVKDEIEEQGPNPREAKKRKTNSDSSGSSVNKVVTNQDQVQDWKFKDGETWQMWRNKTVNGPTLSNNTKPCLKFHVRGSCFDDCTNKASHKRLKGDDFKKTEEFIKNIRRDFN